SSSTGGQASARQKDPSGGTSTRHPPIPDVATLGLLDEEDKPTLPLKEAQITELCLVAFTFVAASAFERRNSPWHEKGQFVDFADERNRGLAYSSWHVYRDRTLELRDLEQTPDMIGAIDVLDDWSVRRLLATTMDIISHRLTVAKWAATLKRSEEFNLKKGT